MAKLKTFFALLAILGNIGISILAIIGACFQIFYR